MTQDPKQIAAGLSEERRHVLLHTLGLTHGDEMYRNHFCTGPGTTDFPHCEGLIKQGLFVRRRGSELSAGYDFFHATELGKQVGLAVRTILQENEDG